MGTQKILTCVVLGEGGPTVEKWVSAYLTD